MPRYRLNALGDAEFESLVQALLKKVIGSGTITFGAGTDGGREATFSGAAPYPSATDMWSGDWIFQVKFHDVDLVSVQRARSNIIKEVTSELDKLINKYRRQFDNYILITNVPLSGVHDKGTLDRIERDIFAKYRDRIPHLAVWGYDDVNRFLDIYPEVRTSYLQLLVSGDLIAQLLSLTETPRSERAITVDAYLRVAMTREQNAQLDQAGDVSEQQIPLQRIFFDLDAYIETVNREAVNRLHEISGASDLPVGDEAHTPLVKLLASTTLDRVVIVGGPGEGKSTIGQYLAQLHRAALLGKPDNEVALTADYVPEVPRIPFRIVLREFAQWLAANSHRSDSLDSFISEQIALMSSRNFLDKDLQEVLRTNPSLLILDGLDEVTDSGVRKLLIARLQEFIERCEKSLRSDLQIVATTRPTGYTDQFDPKTFIHFRLHKVQPNQVRDYVEKWIAGRVLDEGKAGRLRQTIEECIADPQIRLLLNTPLQVTILILIINGCGSSEVMQCEVF